MTPLPPAPQAPHAADIFAVLAALLTGEGRQRPRLALAVLDVDRLGHINLEYGRAAGDAVLARISARLSQVLEPGELAAHWAGDQWVVLLPNARPRAAARRIREIAAHLIRPGPGQAPAAGISAGVAAHPAHGLTNSALVDAAALALVRAKRAGGGRVRLASRPRGF
jgi:diguanylate cyclase (GGDEF)-like protein